MAQVVWILNCILCSYDRYTATGKSYEFRITVELILSLPLLFFRSLTHADRWFFKLHMDLIGFGRFLFVGVWYIVTLFLFVFINITVNNHAASSGCEPRCKSTICPILWTWTLHLARIHVCVISQKRAEEGNRIAGDPQLKKSIFLKKIILKLWISTIEQSF